ncbi:MAG TPA: 4Fe-4S binding protein [Planctomycetota bacterium]|nr:4Fe-4S binding protein [Planctomycetota bacterium]
MNSLRRSRPWVVLALVLGASAWVWAVPLPDFDPGYEMPTFQTPAPRSTWVQVLDVALLAAALAAASWILLRLRSRTWMIVLSVACLAYFGFYRGGCVCPIGATQNVTRGLFDASYHVPVTVILFWTLPLAFCLLAGRVFCGGVCPLGAMQDLVLIRPVKVPVWLERGLRVVPFVYLGAAVLFAATGTMFIICRYDPFVPFFRLAGPFVMFVAGGTLLVLSTFVGRPYCRWLCPYGAVLSLLARVSWKGASITPDECVVCGLCEDACPFGAIESANTPKEDES